MRYLLRGGPVNIYMTIRKYLPLALLNNIQDHRLKGIAYKIYICIILFIYQVFISIEILANQI